MVVSNVPVAQECEKCKRNLKKGGQCKGKKNILMPCLCFTEE